MEGVILIALFVLAVIWARIRYAAQANKPPAKQLDVPRNDGWTPVSSSDSNCDAGGGDGGGGGGGD